MACTHAIMDVLKNVFAYDHFENNIQRKAVFAVAKNLTDVYISMPSGSGRNLCFQLPALLKKCRVVLVFSPDMFFIKEQIKFWKSKEISACLLYASMDINKKMKILKDLTSSAPTLRLIYCTPNMISMVDFMIVVLQLKKRNLLSYIVFNEAHCVSEWEYEYTNYYEMVKQFDEVYGGVPRVAVAPVVTYKVLKDICQFLSLRNPTICKMLKQQSNVYYDTCNIDDLHQPIDELSMFLVQTLDCASGPIQKTDKDSAIIYCRKANQAEELKNKLNGCGIPTLACHYKTKRRTRGILESKWMSGEGCVMTTTYDYGFIHTRPIRVVVYWTVPESIRKYYRESDRPRKENGRIHSRIYFSTKEYTAIKLAIENSKQMNYKDHAENRLNELEELVSYCSSTMCRHVYMFKYFGHVMPICKTNCDVCIMQSIEKALMSESVKYLENGENTECNTHCLNENFEDKEEGIVRNDEPILKNLLLNSKKVYGQISNNQNENDLEVIENRFQKNEEYSLKNQEQSYEQIQVVINNDENRKEKDAQSGAVLPQLPVSRIRRIRRATNRDKKDILKNNLPVPEHTRKNEAVCEAEWIEIKKNACREVESTQSSAVLEMLQNNSPKRDHMPTRVSDNKNSETENAQRSVALQVRGITKGDKRNILNNIVTKSEATYSGANNNNENVDAQTNAKIVIDRKTNHDRKDILKIKPSKSEVMRRDVSEVDNNEEGDADDDIVVVYQNKEKPSTSRTNVTTTKRSPIKNRKYESARNVSQVTKNNPHAEISKQCAISPKSLLKRYNLNENAISLTSAISREGESGTTTQIDQKGTPIIHEQVSTQKSKQIPSADDAHLINIEISNVKKLKNVSSGDYSAVTNAVEITEQNKRSNKRRICINVPEEKSKPIKRRKVVSNNETIKNTKLNLNKRILAQDNEDSETECGWIDCTPPEVLMKKFNLNKNELTLERRTVAKTKR